MPISHNSPFDSWSRRLAVYGYLAPLVTGRRVLELGCGDGSGAERLRSLGASAVVAADDDPQALARARSNVSREGDGGPRQARITFVALERRALEAASGGGFDIIVAPDAIALMRPGSPLLPPAAKALLSPRGRLALMVPNGDRPGGGNGAGAGAGYYEMLEALERLFPSVRMFGVTPFAAYGLAEFSEATAGLRIDGGLVEDASLQPTHYVALAGPDQAFGGGTDLGYALVQVPGADADEAGAGRARQAPAAGRSSDTAELGELRRRLAEAEGKAEGVVRVSRAQGEEIEELRARLRRGAEARAELDQEVTRLRRALAEADESVLDLTRRTREEMNALAQRITAGLRPGGPEAHAGDGDEGPAARLREEVRRRDEVLAARESALSDRDERIAGLEVDRQDLLWQLDEAAARQIGTDEIDAVPGGAVDAGELASALRERQQALEQYRHAAAAHLAEVNRLREALAEQSTLVSELEDALSTRDQRVTALEQEAAGLRRHMAEIEQADRARRSRLAEVEGTLLRLQRQAAVAAAETATTSAPPAPRPDPAAAARVAELERRNEQLGGQVRALEARLREADSRRGELEAQWGEAVERMVGLERAVVAQPEAAPVEDAAPLGLADGPRLESAMKEISRLREALERSEEQLWETKGQLLLDRERMAVLEHEVNHAPPPAPAAATVSEAAHQAIVGAVLQELGEIESGLRGEITRLDSTLRLVEGWRADLAVTDAEGADVPFTGANRS
jgi:SAM-dependent methyltransferase/chromosome segregation ATPase